MRIRKVFDPRKHINHLAELIARTKIDRETVVCSLKCSLNRFIKDMKPDGVVNIGDAADMHSLNRFDKGTG